MTKVERLRWLAQTFGPEYVVPYRVAHSFEELWDASKWALRMFPLAGIRTEGGNGHGYPFVFPLRHLQQSHDLWCKYADTLTYIVSEGISPVRLHGVAIKIGREEALVEINDKEHLIAQRHMYRDPGNLRRFVLGPAGYHYWIERFWRVYAPECGSPLRLDEVYRCLFGAGSEELTFTLAEDGRLIFW